MMGGKRKSQEGRAGSPSRTKPRVAGSDQLDKDNAAIIVSGTGTKRSPGISGSKQPPVDGSVKVELDPEVDAGIAHNNQSQELLAEHSLSTPVLADPDIDIGDDVKILQYPQDDDQLILHEEDEGGSNSKEAEISHCPKAEGRHPVASSSRASERKVVTPESRNDTGTGATGRGKNFETNSKDSSCVNANGISVLNDQVEMIGTIGSNPVVGAPLIAQNRQATVPSQLLTNEQGSLDQASSLSNSVSPQTDTRNPQAKDAVNESPCGAALAENSELKVEAMRKEIEMLRKEVTYFREELTWFKNKYVNSSDWNGELHKAAYEGTEKAVKKLVEDGAYVNSRNKKLDTPIMHAAMRKDKTVGLKIIKYLIENGADPFATDVEKRTFLHILMHNEGSSLTPTHFHDVATYLISTNLAKLFNTPGWSSESEHDPIQNAVYRLEVEGRTLSALHESGVDFKVLDKDGDNLLCWALEGHRSTRLMIDLILLGVDWKHLNKDKRNLLHCAAESCHSNGLKYLLTMGLDVNAVDNHGDTPLHRVIRFGKGNLLETTSVLMENGASVGIKNADERTPLDEAQQRDDMPGNDKDEVIRLLKGSESNDNVLEASN